ncbi:mitochondrial proton/calcium exchanger protein [Tetranychus urticae]|uniref:Mitochondrial proton/calcium exchanger protein n=1 Tax=Tetranychus urticae TaxID=32264 RepID=T1K7H7_TETUR|nr:mitochondrial proton/calcium exchanger protein [Tetranychus urticae]
MLQSTLRIKIRLFNSHFVQCTKYHSYIIRCSNVRSWSTGGVYRIASDCNYLRSTPSIRCLHLSSPYWEKESSKVESTLKALKVKEKENQQKIIAASSSNNGSGKQVDNTKPKRSLGKRIMDEIVHYYHGFRLLFIDIKISSRLAWKVLRSKELSRREHEQLVRTTADLFRLLPFSVFIIVPFMELLLPLFVKIFPNMLPSTFQTTSDKESKIKQQLKVKLEMAKFLQTTLDEMALQSKGESHSEKAKEFAEFFDKIRSSGEQATNEDILRFSKIFEDEITLDSLTRPQLMALCRLIELKPIGTSNFLRFQLRMKLRSLKADDKMIMKEGIDTLTVPELQQACRARGMRALGLPVHQLRSQLAQWLELSLNEQIPPSLLLLSRVLYLSDNLPATDQLKATIQALPAEAVTEARYKIGESEGKIDNKTKIELIKQEEEAIKKEREEEEAIRKEREEEEALKQMAGEEIVDKAAQMTDSSSKGPAKETELSPEDFDSLESALENKDLMLEKEELKELHEEMDEYKEDIEEFQQSGMKEVKISKGAKRLGKRVDKMIKRMDSLVTNLESKKESLEKGITESDDGDKVKETKEAMVNVEELLEAVKKISKADDNTKMEKIIAVLDAMDIDHDGKVEVDHVLKVLELLGREEFKLPKSQMKDIVTMLLQEEQLEDEEKAKKKQEAEKRV